MKKLYTKIFFILGILLFIFFIYKFGLTAIQLITYNFNLKYLIILILVSILAFFPFVWRWQIILKAYGHSPPFITLMRQTIADYSISYTTPFMRVGGEPLRAYMLSKECNIDYKTSSSSVILDKFMEFLGTVLFGVMVLFAMIFFTKISVNLKVILTGLIFIGCFVLFIFYYRTVKKRGTFSSLFNVFKLYKKWPKFSKILWEVEEKMADFFINHKKEFWLSLFFYIISGSFFVLEFKFAFLIFGINASFLEIILAVTVLGLANLTPIPAGLGVLEGGQSGLFELLRGEGGIGMALTLLLRVRTLLIIIVGFGIISHFYGKGLFRK